jgi:hypothetical protein
VSQVVGGRGRRGVDDVVDVAERVGKALALAVVVAAALALAVPDADAVEVAVADAVGEELPDPVDVLDAVELAVLELVPVAEAVGVRVLVGVGITRVARAATSVADSAREKMRRSSRAPSSTYPVSASKFPCHPTWTLLPSVGAANDVDPLPRDTPST